MPNRPHHTEKFKRCVDEVMGKGNDESSAYAICTTSLKESGQEIFEAAEMHQLHVLGANGVAQTEMVGDREHLVVPVTALIEGVIHAVNAKTPEYVSGATLSKGHEAWNGHPLVVGHPVKDGRQISAHDPIVLEKHGFGTVRKAYMNGNRLGMEALVDPDRLEALGHQQLLADLRAGKQIEVSVGAFVTTNDKAGVHNGKEYKAEWMDIMPDHLAFLPGGRGACSMEMGCGAHRAAMHLVTAEGYELVEKPTIHACVAFTTLEGASLTERISQVNAAVDKKWNQTQAGLSVPSTGYAYVDQVFDNSCIVRKADKFYAVPYDVKDGEVVFGEPTEVRQEYVAASQKDCDVCDGSGKQDGKECPACEGLGQMKTAAGARHSEGDRQMIQASHDHMVKLGADCDPHNYRMMRSVEGTTELRAACSCQDHSQREGQMTKEQKAAAIKALVANPNSGFTTGDEAILETASDERIAAFTTAAEARAKEVADLKTAAEASKQAEEKAAADLKAANAKVLTEEEFMKVAPAPLKTLIERTLAADAARKVVLVTELKAAQSEMGEAELSAETLPNLERLAKMLKVGEVKAVDYGGRVVPRAAEDAASFAPPDPYAAGLKALLAN